MDEQIIGRMEQVAHIDYVDIEIVEQIGIMVPVILLKLPQGRMAIVFKVETGFAQGKQVIDGAVLVEENAPLIFGSGPKVQGGPGLLVGLGEIKHVFKRMRDAHLQLALLEIWDQILEISRLEPPGPEMPKRTTRLPAMTMVSRKSDLRARVSLR